MNECGGMLKRTAAPLMGSVFQQQQPQDTKDQARQAGLTRQLYKARERGALGVYLE